VDHVDRRGLGDTSGRESTQHGEPSAERERPEGVLATSEADNGDADGGVAALLDGIGVLMFSPGVATAHAILCRDADREDGDPSGLPDQPVVQVGELEVDRVRCRVRWRARKQIDDNLSSIPG
jgi:hypothetical protein